MKPDVKLLRRYGWGERGHCHVGFELIFRGFFSVCPSRCAQAKVVSPRWAGSTALALYVPIEGVHDVGVAVIGGKYQRRPAMLITSLHIGVVRAGERVHGVGVAVHGGNHQRRPAILINGLHIGVVRACEGVQGAGVAEHGGTRQRRHENYLPSFEYLRLNTFV